MKYLKIINKFMPWEWKKYTCLSDWTFMICAWGTVISPTVLFTWLAFSAAGKISFMTILFMLIVFPLGMLVNTLWSPEENEQSVLKTYNVRIPTISQAWFMVDAFTPEEAWRKVARRLAKGSPNIKWEDESVWETREADGNPVSWVQHDRVK